MHTCAHPTKADDTRLQHEGHIIEPVSLEYDPRSATHSLRIVMRPTGGVNKRVIAHVPVEPGESHTLAAQKMADRINRAAKQGRDAVSLSHRSQDAVLVLQRATLVAHEEPERQETNPPKVEKVADLFAVAA